LFVCWFAAARGDELAAVNGLSWIAADTLGRRIAG
jgi:hypothetical protein